MDTTSPLPPSSTVKLRLTKDKRSFTVEARVIYSLPCMGMGLAFTKAAPEQIAVLRRWIGELSGELAPELSTPEPVQPERAGKTSNSATIVLGSLIFELMRQRVLSNEKGKALLDQLL